MNEPPVKKSAIAKALFEYVPRAGYRKRLPTKQLSAIASQILAIDSLDPAKLHSTKENPRGAHIAAPRFDTC